MISNTAPYHQFKVFVVEDLQKRHRWVGRVGWELFRKYEKTAEEFWGNGAPVECVSDFIHNSYMDRSVKPVGLPTMAEMIAAGCKRHKV